MFSLAFDKQIKSFPLHENFNEMTFVNVTSKSTLKLFSKLLFDNQLKSFHNKPQQMIVHCEGFRSKKRGPFDI